jgi:hypothetical protein
MSTFPAKKKPSEILMPPKEFTLTPWEQEEFSKGVLLFNERRFWNAHESWENVWKHHVEDERLFLQGLIQLAAAYHHLTVKRNLHGLRRNFEKSSEKLSVFTPVFMGIRIFPLLRAIEDGIRETDQLGTNVFELYSSSIIPVLSLERNHHDADP